MLYRLFTVYAYLVPALLFPLSYVLWYQRLNGQHAMVWLVLSMPILSAYIVPALGTNWLRLWEFRTRYRLGRFRPHHGFVFGTATSLIALLVSDPRLPTGAGWLDLLRAGFVLGSVLAFWNWWYDIYAIKAGILRVYNRAYVAGAGAEAIASDYAPVYFGAFGAAYGVALHLSQYYLLVLEQWGWYWPLLIGGNLAVIVTPALAYITASYVTTGTAGLTRYEQEE